MNAVNWVSIVAMTGWLVLALGAYRARRVDGKRTLALALAWGAIFLLATAVFAAIGR